MRSRSSRARPQLGALGVRLDQINHPPQDGPLVGIQITRGSLLYRDEHVARKQAISDLRQLPGSVTARRFRDFDLIFASGGRAEVKFRGRGPAVRCNRFSPSWHSAVLHQCVRSLIGTGLLRTIMDISARAFSLADRPQRARPLPASMAGGAGARPDHSISGHRA